MLKSVRSLLAISFITILITAIFPLDQAHALSQNLRGDTLPPLETFVSQMKNGQSGELRGIYIQKILAVRVIQQPSGNNEFVSPRQNVVTQFHLAARLGSTGLLAHNYLAGESFSLLKKDQQFYLIYGDGRIAAFVIKDIQRYQALTPDSTSSQFLSLEDQSTLTASELFSRVYNRSGSVIFQTCISRENDDRWGRLFVIAEPYLPNP